MPETPETIARILVIHADEETRSAVEEGLRPTQTATVYSVSSPGEGLEAARRLKPRLVLIDLTEQPELALEVVRELRGEGVLIAGLYNPLLLAEGAAEGFFRAATRAGVGDFVQLPVGEVELEAVLATALRADEALGEVAEGRVVTFIAPRGGIGKTTLAVNTALVLAGSGEVDEGVALCDVGLPFGTAAAISGLAPNRDLADLIRDLDDLRALGSYLTPEPRTDLAVLAAPRDPYDEALVSPENLSRVLIRLRRRFGRVVVNAPASLDLLTVAALDLSETICAVMDAVAPNILAARRLIRTLEDQGLGGDRVTLILNRHGGPGQLEEDLVYEQLEREADYLVPFDEQVLTGANRGESPVLTQPDSPFSVAVGEIGEAIARDPARWT